MKISQLFGELFYTALSGIPKSSTKSLPLFHELISAVLSLIPESSTKSPF
jgi:hypothetical protein